MNPPTPSFPLLAAACILSAAIGFYSGKLMRSSERAAEASPAPAVTMAAEQRESPPEPVRLPEVAVVSAKPASVADIIQSVRGSISNGLDVSRLPEFVRALAPLAALDGAAVRDAIDEVQRTVTDPKQKYALFSMLLPLWAERDGRAALAFAQAAETQHPMMVGLEKQVLGGWARREPDAAWAWYLETSAAGGESAMGGPERFLQPLFRALASNDVAAACARMRALPPHEQFAAVQGMTGAAADPHTRDGLLAAAAGFDPEVRRMVYSNVLRDWVLSDPDAAITWLEALPSADRTGAAREVGTKMLMFDPPRAADLMVRNAGDDRSLGMAYALIGSGWGSLNPRAAAEWVNQQPPSAALDHARINFAGQILDRDADAAFAWANAVSNPSSRYSMLQSMYEELHKKDAPHAEQVIQRAGLPIEMVTKIRQSVAGK